MATRDVVTSGTRRTGPGPGPEVNDISSPVDNDIEYLHAVVLSLTLTEDFFFQVAKI